MRRTTWFFSKQQNVRRNRAFKNTVFKPLIFYSGNKLITYIFKRKTINVSIIQK